MNKSSVLLRIKKFLGFPTSRRGCEDPSIHPPMTTCVRICRPIIRFLRPFRDHAPFVLVVLSIVALVFGTWEFFAEKGRPLDIAVYKAVQLFALESPMEDGASVYLQIARYLAGFVTIFTFLTLFAELFLSRILLALVKLRYRKGGHAVICGLGTVGSVFMETLRTEGKCVIVIEKNPKNPGISRCSEYLVPIVIGDATEPSQLLRANADKAGQIFCLTGDDGINLEIATQAGCLHSESNRSVDCVVHVVDKFLARYMGALPKNAMGGSRFQVRYVNIFHASARAMIEKCPFTNRQPKSSDSPRILILGMGRLGEQLIRECANHWKAFRDREKRTERELLRVTVIDYHPMTPDAINATVKVNTLIKRYPGLKNYCDIEPLNMPVPSADFVQGEYFFTYEDRGKPNNLRSPDLDAIYICFDNPYLNISAALQLQDTFNRILTEIQNRKPAVDMSKEGQVPSSRVIPVAIRTPTPWGAARLIEKPGTTDTVSADGLQYRPRDHLVFRAIPLVENGGRELLLLLQNIERESGDLT